jgi:hypothetical protein
MVDTSGAYINSEEKPKKERKPRLSPDAPDVQWDDTYEGYKDKPIPPKKVTPIKKPLSPGDLNIKLRNLYGIPLAVSRYEIQRYLDLIILPLDGTITPVQLTNHKYFLKRYAINGKEFDICWLLLQEGI